MKIKMLSSVGVSILLVTISGFFIPDEASIMMEVCDNGIDDDGDGLIDCFDPDCCDFGLCDDFYVEACPIQTCIDLPYDFQIKKDLLFEQLEVRSAQFIIAGDLDYDGNIEAIGINDDHDVVVLDMATETVDVVIPGAPYNRYSMGELISSNASAELVVSNNGGLFCYDSQGNMLWQNLDNLFQDITYVSIADFNGDGNGEVYVEGGVIVNGQTGQIIINLSAMPQYVEVGDLKPFNYSQAVDILPDSHCSMCSGLEWVIGPYVIAVDIDNLMYSEEANNPRFENRTNTFSLDWDLDGELDVILQNENSIEVWNPIDGSFAEYALPSFPFVGYTSAGNLDADPEPELVFIRANLMTVIDNDLTILWTQPIVDVSGITGVTLFDFNHDDVNEIVYRDETHLRILNGENGNTIKLQDCIAITGAEYPLVLDVDGDNEAEILTICEENGTDNQGTLSVFSSDGITWPDSRPIWNQSVFYNVHINDDLSIPIVQQQPQFVSYEPHLNAFINPIALPLKGTVDLAFSNYSVNNDCEFIILTVCNEGNEDMLTTDLIVSYYEGDPSVSQVVFITEVIGQFPDILEAGECDEVILDIDFGSQFGNEIFVMINDNGSNDLPFSYTADFPNTVVEECLYTNNLFSFIYECEPGDEICDNLIDDDGDGLIDAFDPDCNCSGGTEGESYVPNHDFSMYQGCCNILDILLPASNCLENWQMIAGSPEFYGLNCADPTEVEYSMITPFTEDFVLIGAAGSNSESLATCLTEPLVVGETYTIDLDVGLPDPFAGSEHADAEFSVYGISGINDCNDLFSQIGTNDVNFCNLPIAAMAQELINVESLNLNNFTFDNFTATFTANQNINAIVLVSTCGLSTPGIFYLIESVQISSQSAEWMYTSAIDLGPPCGDEAILSVIDSDTLNYQWYADSIPLAGETNSELVLTDVDPTIPYFVFVYNDSGCILIGPAFAQALEVVNFDTTAICQGEQIVFGSQVINTSGDYTEVYPAPGCDSIANLHVDLNQIVISFVERNICVGDTFVFGALDLTIGGVYNASFQTVEECDSSVTLTLNVNQFVFEDISRQFCEGGSYNFNGEILTEAGVYNDTFFLANQCDSLVTLDLEEIPAQNSGFSASICEGETYDFGNLTLSVAGQYVDTLSTQAGCDSIITLELSVDLFDETSSNEIICEGSSYLFGGEILTNAGIYIDTFDNSPSCPVITTLNLEVYAIDEDTIQQEICMNESYIFGGEEYSSPGFYQDTMANMQGCDSIITLDLIVQDLESLNQNQSICSGDVYNFYGLSLTDPGIYVDTVQSISGCDSVITLTLSVFDYQMDAVVADICEGEVYDFNGIMLSMAGLYTDTIMAAIGCDTIASLNLSVTEEIQEGSAVELCFGDTLLFGNQMITSAGLYTETFMTEVGCDSTVDLAVDLLEFNSGDSTFVTIEEGETFDFMGETFDAAGMYSFDIISSFGCDSIHTLILDLESLDDVHVPNVVLIGSQVGNDIFRLFSNSELTVISYKIYDRWGNKLFHTSNFTINSLDNYWDGYYKNSPVNSGVYVYLIEVLKKDGNSQTYSGDITVIR